MPWNRFPRMDFFSAFRGIGRNGTAGGYSGATPSQLDASLIDDLETVSCGDFKVARAISDLSFREIPENSGSETVSAEDMGVDNCATCTVRNGSMDCRRCVFFLETVEKIVAEKTVAAPLPAVVETVVAPVSKIAESVADRCAPVSKAALPANQSAAGFVRWIQASGRAGQFNDGQLRTAYREYCKADNRRPSADNMLRGALKRMEPVVTKERVRGRYGKGKQTLWIIASPASEPKLEVVERLAA